MGRLIDADESINRIVKIRPTNPKQSDYSHGVDVGLAMAMVAIEEQPTIDPVRKGKWMTSYLDHEMMGVRPKLLYCSECCHCIAYPTNYCPNCGAKMGEGEQDG